MPDSSVQSVTPLIAPLQQNVERQSALLEETSDAQSRNVRKLGRIVLDMERMDARIRAVHQEVKKDLGLRRRYFREKAKLTKKEIKQTEALGTSFLGFRSAIAAIAGASAIREFSQGDIVGGLQDVGVAVTAMLPEITSTVLGAVGLALGIGGRRGRRGPQGPRAAAPRGGMRGGGMRGMGMLALLPLAAMGVSMMMGKGGNAAEGDQRRFELTAREQAANSIITQPDVDRFGQVVTRFGSIVARLLQKEPRDPTIEINKPLKRGDGDGGYNPSNDPDSEFYVPPGPEPVRISSSEPYPFPNRTPLENPKEEALIRLVRDREGTADAKGYNKFFGGDTSVNVSAMTVNEVVAEQKRRDRAGEGRIGRYNSVVVGAGQFKYPANVVRDMGLDPAKEIFSPDLQDRMIIHLAKNDRYVNLEDGIDAQEMFRLNQEWSGLGPYYGQTNWTRQQSSRKYEQYLKQLQKPETETREQTTSQDPASDPMGDQTMALPDIAPSVQSPAPVLSAQASPGGEPGFVIVDPNSSGTSGIDIASSSLLSQYNTPAMFS